MKDILTNSISTGSQCITTYGNCRHKIKSFQYKILNNIIFVNKMLFKSRKVESPMCSFCKSEDETYIHLFYRCRKTSISWRQLQKFFSTALDFPSIRNRVPSSVF